MRTSLRNLALLATALVISLCTASSASAANVVPNPGFEANCSGIPCSWASGGSGATIARDTSTFHDGGASLQMTTGAAGGCCGYTPACITGLAPGTYSAAFWYRTTDSDARPFRLEVYWWSGNCATDLVPSFLSGGSPVIGPTWQEVSGSLTAPAGTDSARIFINGCTTCAAPVTANFDDIKLDNGGPTAVALSSFGAFRSKRGVVLRWRTTSKADTFGFNLYREQEGKPVKLNRTLIPSVFGGTATGHSYSWLDRTAPKGARYRLQAVSLSGKRSWVGSAATGH